MHGVHFNAAPTAAAIPPRDLRSIELIVNSGEPLEAAFLEVEEEVAVVGDYLGGAELRTRPSKGRTNGDDEYTRQKKSESENASMFPPCPAQHPPHAMRSQ